MKLKIYYRCFLLTIIFFCNRNNEILAQSEPMYSQYMFNMMGINPAYVGNRQALSMNFFQRNQWVGMKGAPSTTSFTIDKAMKENTLGMGVQLYDDRIGVESATGLNYMMATKVRISDNGILSGGLSVGLMNYKINLQEVDNRFTSTDPGFISTSNPSQWMPMVGLGLFYNTEKFYVGASTPSILKSRMSGYTNINSSMQNQNSFHFFISSGFVMDLDENVKVKPSTLLKIVSGAPVECDVNVNFWLHDMLGIGGSYRTGDSYVSMLELQATDQLRIGYAYDIPFSPLKYFTKGSHEIMIRYELGNNNYRVKSNRHF